MEDFWSPRPGMPNPLPMTQRLVSNHPDIMRGTDAPLRSGGVDRAGAVNPKIAVSSAVVSILPWWEREYPTAQDWVTSSISLSAAANATTTVTGFSITIEPQNIGVIKFVEMSVQSATATMDLSLNLLLNGGPVSGWTDVPFPSGSAALMVKTFSDMVVRMPQGSKLTASFKNDTASAFTVSLTAMGWQVPLTDVQRLSGGLNY